MAVRSFEAKLALIEGLRARPENARAELEKMLAQKNNFLVARAVEVAAELELVDLFPAMEAAFRRFLEDAADTDKTCRAKTAIVRALVAGDHRAEEIYLAGIRHVQLEPVFGGRQDTAVELRGLCADALVKFHSPDVVERLAVLLADAEKGARAAAARSIGDSGRREGVPLLEFKILIGDAEPEVLTECFASLLRLSAVEFVEPYLSSEDPVLTESAALAFGEARVEGTERALIAASEREETRKVVYLALAMMRTRIAIDHLLAMIEAGDERAVEALEIYRYDEALMARVRAALDRAKTLP